MPTVSNLFEPRLCGKSTPNTAGSGFGRKSSAAAAASAALPTTATGTKHVSATATATTDAVWYANDAATGAATV